MSDLLSEGSEWLADELEQHASREIIYRRGTDEVETVATLGDGNHASRNVEGADWSVAANYRAFMLRAATLELRGIRITPDPGDQIEDPLTGTIWEVTDLPGERCWRWSDPGHTRMRIHTLVIKQV